MQKGYEIDRDMLMMLLVVLGVGVLIGVLLAPKGSRTERVEKSHDEGRNRAGANFVFGNIIIGSNNAPHSKMEMGYDDRGDN